MYHSAMDRITVADGFMTVHRKAPVELSKPLLTSADELIG
jgi:hypothetical protein